MKKTARNLVVLLALLTLLAMVLPLYASANQAVSPYYNNCSKCTCTFNAATGNADVYVSYTGIASTFSYTKLTVKIQKRFLGVFWTTVDLGLTSDEWIAYNYSASGHFINSFPLEKTGTYRAVFTVEIYGKDGSVDTIEDTITSTYD